MKRLPTNTYRFRKVLFPLESLESMVYTMFCTQDPEPMRLRGTLFISNNLHGTVDGIGQTANAVSPGVRDGREGSEFAVAAASIPLSFLPLDGVSNHEKSARQRYEGNRISRNDTSWGGEIAQPGWILGL